MAAQHAADLRTLVTRRVGLKKRVVVLASDLALVRVIEGNGCTVLVDPASLDEIGAFHPDVVVAFDGFALSEGGAAFRALASAAGQADLVFSFANASSASSLLGALTNSTPTPSFAEPDVRRWLASAGYVVSARDVVVTAHRTSGLSADTEAALRQVLEQVNPDAAADRLLLFAKRGTAATAPDRTPGLVSVVVSSAADESQLAGTLSSLVNQQRRPLELIAVATLPADRLDALLEKPRARSGVTVVPISSTSSDASVRTNVGLAAAQGQYLAFTEAGALFAPTHFSTLVKRLEDATTAWALGTSSVAGAKRFDRAGAFSLAGWLTHGWVNRSEWLLDTSRLGPFPITFAEGISAFEAVFFTRLALLFPPSWSPGAPSVECLQAPAVDVAALLEAMKGRPLRALVTLDELLKEPKKPELAALVGERLAEADPRAKEAFDRTKAVVDRVRSAWTEARRAAKRDLEKK
ncbi:MAG: glycosyltransferase family A protein [Myxococcales bacterium]|nr:glycosyltransferase family A protein [Myxococcales bacterium]